MEYDVKKTLAAPVLNADLGKSFWESIKPATLTNVMGEAPRYLPETQAKLAYDNNNLYLSFKVKDKFTIAVATEHHQKVWEDSCVEFFFTPGSYITMGYFNLEINCLGKVYMQHQKERGKGKQKVSAEDIEKFEIASTYTEPITDEIKEENTWCIELKIPYKVLEKYTEVQKPAKGVVWKANFNKCADKSSNPHWITWAKVDYPRPNFHMPEYFGNIHFE